MSGKCEHGLTTKECLVCASPKYGTHPQASDLLVQRLREEAQGGGRYVRIGLFAEAADRIEADEALMRQALEALAYCIEHSAEIVAERAKERGQDSDDLQMMMTEYLEKHRGVIAALRERLGEKP